MTEPKYYKSTEGKYIVYYFCIDNDSTEVIEQNTFTHRLMLRDIGTDAPLPGGNPTKISAVEYSEIVSSYAYEENRNGFVKFLLTSWLSIWYLLKNPPVYLSFLTPTAKAVLGIGVLIGPFSTSLSMWSVGICAAMTSLTSPGSDNSNMTMIYWSVLLLISSITLIIQALI